MPSAPAAPAVALLCAGDDVRCAARLGELADEFLADRRAVVLSTWHSGLPSAPIDFAVGARHDHSADFRSQARTVADAAADAACAALVAAGWEVERRVVDDERRPWQVALGLADELGATVIVAGRTQRERPSPNTLGDEARGLAHRTRRPLLVLDARATPRPQAPAVVAYDGSHSAHAAVRRAAELLRPRPAVVTTVWQPRSNGPRTELATSPGGEDIDRLDDALREEAQRTANAAAEHLRAAGWPVETQALAASINAAGTIVGAAAARDAALIVVGTRGRSRIAAALLGSSAEAILRDAACPVLLVPPHPAG